MESFEDRIGDIEEILEKCRKQWHLDAIQWFDYDDIKQHIRNHIFNKWHLWKQDKNFKPWCYRVVTNQIKNIRRNNYDNFKKPCLGCEFYMGDDECGKTLSGKQDTSCADYAKWVKKKKDAYNVNFAVSIEDKVLPETASLYDNFDFEKSASNLHEKVKSKLENQRHREIYHMVYVLGECDDVVAKKMNFSRDGNSKNSRFKQLDNLKKKFFEIASEIMRDEDILQ